MFDVIKSGERLYFTCEKHVPGERFAVPLNNTKVQLPIINAGSGLSCPNRAKCPFSLENYKKTGYPRCYAQDGENRFKSIRESKEKNTSMLLALSERQTIHLAGDIADALAIYAPFTPWIRINEAHDLSNDNIMFFVYLQKALDRYGKKLYGYTKSSPGLKNALKSVGSVIIESEKDFVMVRTKEEADKLGLPLCPGICGPCTRCMEGLRTAVIGH